MGFQISGIERTIFPPYVEQLASHKRMHISIQCRSPSLTAIYMDGEGSVALTLHGTIE